MGGGSFSRQAQEGVVWPSLHLRWQRADGRMEGGGYGAVAGMCQWCGMGNTLAEGSAAPLGLSVLLCSKESGGGLQASIDACVATFGGLTLARNTTAPQHHKHTEESACMLQFQSFRLANKAKAARLEAA